MRRVHPPAPSCCSASDGVPLRRLDASGRGSETSADPQEEEVRACVCQRGSERLRRLEVRPLIEGGASDETSWSNMAAAEGQTPLNG